MKVLTLGQKLREALDEPALQLLEEYDIEFAKLLPLDFDIAELGEYVNSEEQVQLKEYTQTINESLTWYCHHKGQNNALGEVKEKLEWPMLRLEVILSHYSEAKRKEKLRQELNKPLAILKFHQIPPEITSVVSLDASKYLNKWLDEVYNIIPELGQLGLEEVNADISTYLNEDDKALVIKNERKIVEWVLNCSAIGNGYSPEPFSIWVISPKGELKELLEKVYKAKRKKQEEAAQKEEYDRLWPKAYKAINPPDDDAKRYLSSDGYERFKEAAREAIDLYIEMGDKYLEPPNSFDYRYWIRQINVKKEEEQEAVRAHTAANIYNHDLLSQLKSFKAELYTQRQVPLSFLLKQTNRDFTFNFQQLQWLTI